MEELRRVDTHQALEHVALDHRFGDDALAAREQHIDLRVLLVGVDVARQQIAHVLSAAALRQQAHPAVVARHERAFRRRERHVEITRCVLAVQHPRVERIRADMRQLRAGLLADERASRGRLRVRVVVGLVARDLRFRACPRRRA